MSTINNTITTTFRARGNQAIAQMGTVSQGFGNIARSINDTTRLSTRLNDQWRALGTTIRYAVAGQAIFGLTRMIGQLKDVQQQLGLMQAIGEPAGGGIFSDNAIKQMGDSLRQASVDSLTPINEINDATINYLSTVQGVKQSELPDIIKNIGQAAKLSQTPVEDLTKAASTLNVAFGRQNNFKNISEFNRMWFALIKTAPGGVSAAPEIAAQIPTLASMFQMAPGRSVSPRLAQAQMMSLTLGAVRTGAPPAVAMRGLTYLLQSVAQPTGGAAKALAGIGITPQFVERRGVYAATMKLLRTITNTGRIGAISAIPDDQLDDQSNLPGIPAAEMTRLRKMIPRIHGIRAAIILAHQLRQRGNVQSLNQDLQMMVNEQNNNVDDAHNMALAWKNFQKRAKLQQASIAINNMALQVAQTFEPVLNWSAGHLVTGPQHWAQNHPKWTHRLAWGGLAAIGGITVGRMLGGGKLLGKLPLFNRLFGGGGGGLGHALVEANAAKAMMAGGATLGASPTNPLYVVVVDQLIRGGNFGGGSRTPLGKAASDAERVGEDVAAAKGGSKFFGLLGKVRRFPGGVGNFFRNRKLDTAIAMDALDATGHAAKFAKFAKFAGPVGTAATIFDYFYNADPAGQGEGGGGRAAAWQRGNRLISSQRSLAKANQLWGTNGNTVTGMNNPFAGVSGELWMNITLKHPDGTTTQKRVHVPVKMWANKYPSQGGKPGKTQRSN